MEIPNLLDTSKSLEYQAKQAFEIRNDLRTRARELMADQKAADYLRRNEPNLTWDELVTIKSIKYGDGSVAFSPNTAGGPLGNEILLPNEFSISALRHEYGHFLDHQALGSPRYMEYFKKPELILSTERRLYLGEIRTAREIGDTSARDI
jgi:hypothetical protein